MLISFPDADVYEITKDGISLLPYTQTEHFRVTKDYLNNPERSFRYLFEEE